MVVIFFIYTGKESIFLYTFTINWGCLGNGIRIRLN
jgi:hypothetical protein